MVRIEGDLERALKRLRNYFAEKNIPFALVGALVPALLLSSEVGARETRDADHVIKLTSWADWEAVIADLVGLGFKCKAGQPEHRLYYGNAEIDLIPYGITDGPEEVLVWRNSGNQMNLTGFSDVFRCTIQTEITEGLTLPIVPLWLFAVLKVIAYLDRALPRDMRDLIFVAERYDEGSRRFDVLQEAEDVTYETAGAYLLGVDIRLKASPQSVSQVMDFIEGITDEHHAAVNAVLRDENLLFSDRRRQQVYRLFASLRRGLK